MRLRFLRLASITLLFLLSATGKGQISTSDTSSVEGLILDAGTGRPLADVRVWTDRSPFGEFTPTDPSGRFKLGGVPPGTRAIRVRKQGYALAKSVGLKTPGSAASAALVNVEPEEPVRGVVVQLVPEATISGRILPGDRAPAVVNLARYTYDGDGERTLVAVDGVVVNSETDKWGEYRFEGLEAGEYYVYFGPTLRAPLTYYPEALDVAGALRLIVNPGTNLRLDDLRMAVSVQAPSVRFHVINATGDPSADQECLSVVWKPTGLLAQSRSQSASCTDGLEQSYLKIDSMAPGFYDAYAGWVIGNRRTFVPFVGVEGASVSFEVRDADLEIDVVVSRARLTGSILLEQPNGTRIPAAGMKFSLKSKGAGPAIDVNTGADGSFLQNRLGGGHYTVEFPDLPLNAYIADLTEGQQNVLADGLEIGSTDLYLNGLISLRGGTVEGTIHNAPGAIVVLVPDSQQAGNSHRYHVISTNQSGEFRIRGIAPGAYRLFAWSALEGEAYRNADFMKKYAERGIPVAVKKGLRVAIEAALLD